MSTSRRVLSPTSERTNSIDYGVRKMSLSKADTPKVSTPKLGPKMAADIQMTPRLEKTLKQFKQYKGAVQFVEEYTCRYCGSTRMDPLRKGLDSKARRQLATLAVTEINKHMPPQYNIRLRVTDKGLAGINAKKRKGIFFDKADDIQYLLAGRKNGKKSPATYVLAFSKDSSSDKAGTVVHLLRFNEREEVNDLYHAVHRMMRDNMFSQLFDIHSEEQQAAFDPANVLDHAKDATDSIERAMVVSMAQACDRIDSLLGSAQDLSSPSSPRPSQSGGKRSMTFDVKSPEGTEYLDIDC